MPAISDQAVKEQRLRDRIADGDAARDYARTHDLSSGWLYEITKRLLIEIERCLKELEDDYVAGSLRFDPHADAIEKLRKSLIELSKSQVGRAVLAQAEAESYANDQSELETLARRVNAALAREDKKRTSRRDA